MGTTSVKVKDFCLSESASIVKGTVIGKGPCDRVAYLFLILQFFYLVYYIQIPSFSMERKELFKG